MDKIDLTAYRSLVFITAKDGDPNTIDLPGSAEINLTSVTVAQLTADDVIFYNRDADNTLNGDNNANTVSGVVRATTGLTAAAAADMHWTAARAMTISKAVTATIP